MIKFIDVVPEIRAALAEMGWDDIDLIVTDTNITTSIDALPSAVFWAAGELAAVRHGIPHACWRCWEAEHMWGVRYIRSCMNGGACAYPDEPRWPDRELLVRR